MSFDQIDRKNKINQEKKQTIIEDFSLKKESISNN